MAKNTFFNVSLEINIEAENPLDAAIKLQEWMQEIHPAEKVDWQFYVQNSETKELFSVDLAEEMVEDAVLTVKLEDYSPIIEK